MTPNHAEVLSAFFDGEAVEPDSLAASLEEPEGVTSLVEFARLRRAMREDTSRPPEQFSERLRSRIARAEAFQHTKRRLLEVAVAASLALVGAASGFGVRGLYERQPAATSARSAPSTPPPPATTTPASPAAAPPRASSAPAPVASSAGRDRKVPAQASVPAPNLRMLFTRWDEKAL